MKGRLKNVQTTFFMSLLSIIGRAELLTLVRIGGITRQAHARRVAVARLRSRFFVHQNLAVFPDLHGYGFTVFQLPFQHLRIGILTLVDRTAAFSRHIAVFINHTLLLAVGTSRIGSNGKQEISAANKTGFMV